MPSYTAAEKENALRLCDEIGVSKASRETGISRSTLVNWHSDAENKIATTIAVVDEIPVVEDDVEEIDTNPKRESKSSGTRYSAEEKENALRLYDEVGVTKASKQTGITINSLRKWRADAQNKSDTTAAATDEIPVGVEAAEHNDLHTESASTDIIARLTKTSAEEQTMEETDQKTRPSNPYEELIRLRLENTTLKAQMAALKNAIRVFTE